MPWASTSLDSPATAFPPYSHYAPRPYSASRPRGPASVSSAELQELAAIEKRIRSGKEPLVSGEAMLRETLKDLRKIRGA